MWGRHRGDITYAPTVQSISTRISQLPCPLFPSKDGWIPVKPVHSDLDSPTRPPFIDRDAENHVTRWPAAPQSRGEIDQVAVDEPWNTVEPPPIPLFPSLTATLPLQSTGCPVLGVGSCCGHTRQLQCPDTLMRHLCVWTPWVDILIHGLLLVSDHPYREQHWQPRRPPGRPAAVRDAWASSRQIATCR